MSGWLAIRCGKVAVCRGFGNRCREMVRMGSGDAVICDAEMLLDGW